MSVHGARPTRYGEEYVRCEACNVLRPPSELSDKRCKDAEVCSKLRAAVVEAVEKAEPQK